jgi:hypothetical protein
MPPYVLYPGLAWAVLTAVLIILLIYRSTLTMQEDEQLFLDDSASQMAAEQRELVAKVNKINPFVKILGATSGVGFLLLAGMMIYSGLNQVQ